MHKEVAHPNASHSWVVYATTGNALASVFQLGEEYRARLVASSPFLDLAVERMLAKGNPERSRTEKYVNLQLRCVQVIRDVGLAHSTHSSIYAVRAFETAIDAHLANLHWPPHRPTPSERLTPVS